MCSSFIIIVYDDLGEIISRIEISSAPIHLMPDWPARRTLAFPKTEVPLIVAHDDRLKPAVMKWGYEVAWNNNVIFNTRADTAMKPGHSLWAESLHTRRCIIPSLGFFEPHQTETFINPRSGKKNKQKYLFESPDLPLLFIAGIYENDHFSMMTTEPNDIVAPIHNRMPVVLQQNEIKTWLWGDYPSLFDRSTVSLKVTKASSS